MIPNIPNSMKLGIRKKKLDYFYDFISYFKRSIQGSISIHHYLLSSKKMHKA